MESDTNDGIRNAGIFRAHVPLLVKDYMRGWTGFQTISPTRYERVKKKRKEKE